MTPSPFTLLPREESGIKTLTPFTILLRKGPGIKGLSTWGPCVVCGRLAARQNFPTGHRAPGQRVAYVTTGTPLCAGDCQPR